LFLVPLEWDFVNALEQLQRCNKYKHKKPHYYREPLKETFMAQKQERVKGENRERAASYYPFYTKEKVFF